MGRRKRRKFTAEYKAEVVRLVQTGGKSVGQIAEDLDLTETAVRGWVRRAGIDEKRDPHGPADERGARRVDAAVEIAPPSGDEVAKLLDQIVDDHHEPIAIAALAQSLPRSAFRKVTWREGSRGKMSSRFACLRVRSAEGHSKRRPPSEEQWLICEWPHGEAAPTKY